MVDLTLYSQRMDAYKTGLQDGEITSIQDAIMYEFKANPSYEQISYNGTNKDVHIVDNNKSFTRKVGDKKLLGYPNDTYQNGDYLTLWSDTWIILSKDTDSKVQEKCYINRCNNMLKFYDDNGLYHEIPCVVTKNSLYDLDDDTKMALPMNQIRVVAKFDATSKLIKWADSEGAEQKYTRFILNGDAFRVVAIDKTSSVKDGVGCIDIRMTSDMIKAEDDLVNNIAYNYTNNATVSILNGNSTIAVGQTLQLNVEVLNNGVAVVNPTLKYTSSNITKATVSPTGLVTAIATTSPTINLTVEYGDKSSIITLAVTGVISHNYTMDFSASNGNLGTLVLNQTNVYSVKTLDNGVEYVDTVTFNVTDDTGLVPSTYVSIVETVGNTIKIKANNVSGNVGKYFRIYGVGTDKTDYIRVMIKGIF